MNLSFIRNTNLASLLMFSLSVLPIYSVFCSNTDIRLNSRNNDKYFNIVELTPNGSVITSKIYNTDNGYVFAQGGHNVSIGTEKILSVPKSAAASIYSDIAYRYLFNRDFCVNSGLGLKLGGLTKDKDESLGIRNYFNLGFGVFAGVKHKNGIEGCIQLDFPLNNSKVKKGVILNLKYSNLLSLEIGLSNLYATKDNDKWTSFFGAVRFNTGIIISKILGDIGKEINKYINLQILISIENLSKLKEDIWSVIWIETKVGLLSEEKGLIDGYNTIDAPLKNNTMEYGWQKQTNDSKTETNEEEIDSNDLTKVMETRTSKTTLSVVKNKPLTLQDEGNLIQSITDERTTTYSKLANRTLCRENSLVNSTLNTILDEKSTTYPSDQESLTYPSDQESLTYSSDVVETPTNVVETPTKRTTLSVVKNTSNVVETPTNVVETPTNVVETPTKRTTLSVVKNTSNVVETPTNVVKTPTKRTTLSVVENASDVVETPTNMVETPTKRTTLLVLKSESDVEISTKRTTLSVVKSGSGVETPTKRTTLLEMKSASDVEISTKIITLSVKKYEHKLLDGTKSGCFLKIGSFGKKVTVCCLFASTMQFFNSRIGLRYSKNDNNDNIETSKTGFTSSNDLHALRQLMDEVPYVLPEFTRIDKQQQVEGNNTIKLLLTGITADKGNNETRTIQSTDLIQDSFVQTLDIERAFPVTINNSILSRLTGFGLNVYSCLFNDNNNSLQNVSSNVNTIDLTKTEFTSSNDLHALRQLMDGVPYVLPEFTRIDKQQQVEGNNTIKLLLTGITADKGNNETRTIQSTDLIQDSFVQTLDIERAFPVTINNSILSRLTGFGLNVYSCLFNDNNNSLQNVSSNVNTIDLTNNPKVFLLRDSQQAILDEQLFNPTSQFTDNTTVNNVLDLDEQSNDVAGAQVANESQNRTLQGNKIEVFSQAILDEQLFNPTSQFTDNTTVNNVLDLDEQSNDVAGAQVANESQNRTLQGNKIEVFSQAILDEQLFNPTSQFTDNTTVNNVLDLDEQSNDVAGAQVANESQNRTLQGNKIEVFSQAILDEQLFNPTSQFTDNTTVNNVLDLDEQSNDVAGA